jgi:F-type H+-transporting ATPase subunit delta
MRGVSRASFAELKDQLPEALTQGSQSPAGGGSPSTSPPTTGSAAPSSRATTSRATAGRSASGTSGTSGAVADPAGRAETVGNELFSVLHLLDREHGLRRALADPSRPADEKGAIVVDLLHGKISEPAEALVAATVRAQWASSADMTDALEQLAIEAFAFAAEDRGQLDDLEDDLFRFNRVVATQPELRAALTETVVSPEHKQELLDALLGSKVSPVALRLVSEMSLYPRGRSIVTSLDLCTRIAAERRRRLIAVVRTPTAPTAEQRQRLAQALAGIYGHEVYINVIIDPTVVGGMTIQVGDELIDGSMATRLGSLRRKLTN